jgi:hypothetical protein
MYENSRRNNALVVAAAVAVALLAWAVVRLAGIEHSADTGNGSHPVGAAGTIVAALVAGIAACAVHALLVRWRHVRWWSFIASTALAVSMLGPTYLAHGESVAALMCMHFAVGAVLIGGLAMLGPRERWCGPATPDRHTLPQGY